MLQFPRPGSGQTHAAQLRPWGRALAVPQPCTQLCREVCSLTHPWHPAVTIGNTSRGAHAGRVWKVLEGNENLSQNEAEKVKSFSRKKLVLSTSVFCWTSASSLADVQRHSEDVSSQQASKQEKQQSPGSLGCI